MQSIFQFRSSAFASIGRGLKLTLEPHSMPETSQSQLVLIPTYNTGDIVYQTVRSALEVWSPVWVVVDGSDDGTAEGLEKMADEEPGLRVFRHKTNCGKGAAVLTGLRAAEEEGFTSVLTMDADGQHPASRIERFMEVARKMDGSLLVLGLPQFGDCAPGERLAGRRIANMMTSLVTVGGGVRDCLFGFRVYPVRPLLGIMEECRFARRFDFDPEVAVRLSWAGLPVVNVPCECRYLKAEEGGVSHFNYVRDNLLLSWMYLRLLFGMVWRFPMLVVYRFHRGKGIVLAE